jgi:hypothetical protein
LIFVCQHTQNIAIPNHKKNYQQGAKQVWAPQSRGLCGLLLQGPDVDVFTAFACALREYFKNQNCLF